MSWTERSRRVPPLGWVALGLIAQQILAGGRRPSRASATLAGGTAVISLGLLASSVTSFRRRRTTVDPLTPERARHLVVEGPFRITRNPMYVAMSGVLLAHAVARRSLLALLPTAGFVVVINKSQIEAEEQALAANFGSDWGRYAATTPRWLSLRPLIRRDPGKATPVG
ncbi:MAG TPA: isoprenylcysteine carboxylmethyltransferase family protein [Aeromicrobium sp.]|nr:isoprenylcysteine carboxylmethyltransferase family protein [Aeromicrobium sp.]